MRLEKQCAANRKYKVNPVDYEADLNSEVNPEVHQVGFRAVIFLAPQ